MINVLAEDAASAASVVKNNPITSSNKTCKLIIPIHITKNEAQIQDKI
jgi:hypothetical protein